MDIKNERQDASLQSLGSSTDVVLNTVIDTFKELKFSTDSKIIDVGCGRGDLLRLVKNFGYENLTGCDYTDFDSEKPFDFFIHDCNEPFPDRQELFDIVLTSEVIEHIENPWLFLRSIRTLLKPGGSLILSTPNPESFLSILTLVVKGYFNAFGPRSYPAHITPVMIYELQNMINKVGGEIQSVSYMPNGRIPGTALVWQDYFPFIKGKRFAENYLVHATF